MGEYDAESTPPDRPDSNAAPRPVPAGPTSLNGHGLNGHHLNGHGDSEREQTARALPDASDADARPAVEEAHSWAVDATTPSAAGLASAARTGAGAIATPAEQSTRTLSISAALSSWARGLFTAGILLLVAAGAVLASVIAILTPEAWSIDLMIVLAGLPVALAVAWIVRRAAGVASDSFVGAVTRTPLVAIAPPPRPGALGSPWAVLRAIGLVPAVVVLLVLGAVVIAGDALALGRSDEALRVGAAAITCDGLIALAALLLALGGAVAHAGRAVSDRERQVGARFYAVALPDGQNGLATGICAVPEPA